MRRRRRRPCPAKVAVDLTRERLRRTGFGGRRGLAEEHADGGGWVGGCASVGVEWGTGRVERGAWAVGYQCASKLVRSRLTLLCRFGNRGWGACIQRQSEFFYLLMKIQRDRSIEQNSARPSCITMSYPHRVRAYTCFHILNESSYSS
jgi:hypothetical protein